MSYQVLARKWRPRTLETVIGQDTTVRILANALRKKRLHHAYLLTGTRGVGKTTLGRILAKCLNCETGITPTPCQTCAMCISIDQGDCLDLYEIDAASRTKVEDTRELLETVPYPPAMGRYKVYLIDEAHMLSHYSFNALLKTLEEPPEHVKFILATTDSKRLPITILSRCLQFHLTQITTEHIAAHLQQICHSENISHTLPALQQLAQAAEGSMRDALSLLDQAIVYSEESLTEETIQQLLGHITSHALYPLLDSLAQQDGKQLFREIATIAEKSPDFKQVLAELISILHRMALIQILSDESIESSARIHTLAKQFSPETTQLYYQIALLGRRDLEYAPSKRQGFEMTLLRMLAFRPLSTVTNAPASTPTHLTETSTSMPEWQQLLPQLSLTGMAHTLAANCTCTAFVKDTMTLALFENHQPMLNAKLTERIQEALTQYFKRPIQLKIILTQDSAQLTPLKQKEEAKQTKIATLKQSILDNPAFKQFIDQYDATIDIHPTSL